MTFLVFAVVGFVAGWRLGPGRRRFVAIAAISIVSAIVEISHLLMTADRSRMTMMPLIAGALMVSGLLVGALVRRPPRSQNAV